LGFSGAGYASDYADWFYDQYIPLKFQQQNRWVFAVLNQVSISLHQGHKVLLIVIDDFNFKFVRTLVESLCWLWLPRNGQRLPV